MNQGFLRVAALTPRCVVGDCQANADAIIVAANRVAQQGVQLAVFPELCLTGYTCGDLFAQESLIRDASVALRRIARETASLTLVTGLPVAFAGKRYNCAAVSNGGRVRGIIPKTHIPNYGEFYELRHFAPAPESTLLLPEGLFDDEPIPLGTHLLFRDRQNFDVAFAIEICEDVWVPSPPSSFHAAAGALIICNPSASTEVAGKTEWRRTLISGQSGRLLAAYVYADAGKGESTTDLVFSGHNLIAEYGAILAESLPFTAGEAITDIDLIKLNQERYRINTWPGFKLQTEYTEIPLSLLPTQENAVPQPELLRSIDPLPFVPSLDNDLSSRCEEILNIQTAGLEKRLMHTGCKTVVIGVSGGLDSTLALLVCARTFRRLQLSYSGIIAVTMPGFGTTRLTHSNARTLANLLGTSLREIPIHRSVERHFRDIGQDPSIHDVTYENAQARERTQILMDIANQVGGLVIGTGDLSELALGWATYNGDHMSMYAVNSSVPKTLVRHLVAWFSLHPEQIIADKELDTALQTNSSVNSHEKNVFALYKKMKSVLSSILNTPVSPELLPPKDGKISQKTEDLVGPYELHDFFLYYMTRWGFSPKRILFLASNAFSSTEAAKRSITPHEPTEILQWLKIFYRRFFAQQFKRSCLPDGPKVGSVSLSPRGDWRMPSDASSAGWLKELEDM